MIFKWQWSHLITQKLPNIKLHVWVKGSCQPCDTYRLIDTAHLTECTVKIVLWFVFRCQLTPQLPEMGWVKHSIFKSTKQQLCMLSWPEHPRVCRDLPWWGPSPWSWSAGFSLASQRTGAGAGCRAARWTERCAPESIPVVIINTIHITRLQRWVQGTEPKLGHHKKGQTGLEKLPTRQVGQGITAVVYSLEGIPRKRQNILTCRLSTVVLLIFLCSFNIYATEILFCFEPELRAQHVGSFFTNEQKTRGSWHRRHLYPNCQSCSWHHRHGLPVTKW